MGAWKQSLRKARSLKPSRVRQDARRPFRIELRAADAREREALCRVLIPDEVVGRERTRASEHLCLPGGVHADIVVCTPLVQAEGVVVDPAHPEIGLRNLLRAYPRYRLALGRIFSPIRQILARDLIQAVASRNAAIAAISALPEVIPNPLSLILALGEMGSDTVLITANQIGLAFELAALHGESVGWRAQSGRIGLVLAAAFGWRTLARALLGLIPAGYGLAAKTGVAYSGSLAVGSALWKYERPSLAPASRRPEPIKRTQAALNQRQSA
ncbi:MAG: hypothetical protein ACRD0Y_06430 [Terriglobales bacterium]